MEPPASTGAKIGRNAAQWLRLGQRSQEAAAAAWKVHQQASAERTAQQPPPETAGARAARTQHALQLARRQLMARCGHVLSRIGLQVSAVFFLLFAASFGYAGFKTWMAERAHAAATHVGAQLSGSLTQASPTAWVEFLLALLFAYFGISSLARAAARRP